MRNYSFETKHNGYKYTFRRINKTVAEKAYNDGLTVLFCPCNLRPDNNYYGLSMDVNRIFQNCDFQPFQTVLNAYEVYNCMNDETGRYTAFYIPVTDEIKSYTDYDKPGKLENYDHRYMRLYYSVKPAFNGMIA